MCKIHHKEPHFGSKLEHGEAHTKDHLNWSRRQFLLASGAAGAGSFFLGSTPVTALASNPLMAAVNQADSDNVLVMLRLFGGNDGLNTIVPHTDDVGNDKYLEFRPGISMKYGSDYTDNHLLSGFGPSNYAVPSVMEPIMDLWHNNEMTVVHNVGYPSQNFSHFTSSNNWASAANNKQDPRYTTGWMGRYLDYIFPSYLEAPPAVPVALQIGFSNNLIFKAPGGISMDLVFNNPDQFYQLAQQGQLYETNGFGECPQDVERVFLRQTTNNSLRYADTVSEAYNKTENKVPYPDETTSRLHDQMAIVARLIKGQLGTKIYMVNIGGFDNHSGILDRHPGLLEDVAGTVRAFYDDLKADGVDKNVVVMTFSEFGRTIKQNGSAGTDHGTLSPLMLFGDAVNGGFVGQGMNLHDPRLEEARQTRIYFEEQPSIDYRSVYATVLQDWLCVDPEIVDFAMGAHYDRIPNLFENPCSPLPGSNGYAILLGHNPQDQSSEEIQIKYAVQKPGHVRIQITDRSGNPMHSVINEFHTPGVYSQSVDPQKAFLQPGEYLYRMDTGGQQFTKALYIQ